MKKLILFCFLLIVPIGVNAERVSIVNTTSFWANYGNEGGGYHFAHTYSDGTLSPTIDNYFVTVPYYAKLDVFNPYQIGFNYGTYNYCNGQSVTIKGTFYHEDARTFASGAKIWASGANYGQDALCTSTITNTTNIDFTCTYSTLNGPINIYMDNLNYSSLVNYSIKKRFGSIKTFEYVCENSSILENDNRNTQSIIDNQNRNQQETNKRLDDLNNSMTSDSEDVNSKSCGMICKLKNIASGIVNLPKTLINLLIDALKSLFVPSDSQLQEIINDSQELANNCGFIGQSISFFIDIFTSLLGMVNANGCITLPAFKIGGTTLFSSHTFWNEQQVCLSNNTILSSNIDTIRTITSIALVCLFISFSSGKFFGILSKNDSGSSGLSSLNSNENVYSRYRKESR